MKALKSLDDHTEDIIEGRRRTRAARFKALPEGMERVDEVLQFALAYLHERLRTAGFRAAISQLTLSRKLGEITQVLKLRPGPSNLSGVNIEVSAEAQMKSASLKRWTGSLGTKYAREHLWVRQLGALDGKNDFFKWQLVDPKTRTLELDDLLAKIRTRALPAFDAWADKSSIAQAVFRFTEIDRIDWLVETALWSENRTTAVKLVQHHLSANARDAASFAMELARFRSDPSIEEPQPRPASGLAFLVAKHQLAIGDG